MKTKTRVLTLGMLTAGALSIASPAFAWDCPGTTIPCASSDAEFNAGGCTINCPSATPTPTPTPTPSATITPTPVPTTTPPVTPAVTHSLPFTGAPTNLLLTGGVGLVVIGGVAATAAYKRRTN